MVTGRAPLPLNEHAPIAAPPTDTAAAHLRSTMAVAGYHVKASDGPSGLVCDFMIEDKSWALRKLVIKIGHRFSGKEVEISTGSVIRISYEESTVFVNLTVGEIENSPAHTVSAVKSA
jgi:hypothetical protein